MNKDTNSPPQTSLLLRLLGGGYLIYLAWELRAAIQENPVFLIAVLVFGLVGAALLIHSLVTLLRHGYFRKDEVRETETTEDCEERSDD
nr:hypothetical protein [Oscillospiraceae bacterium]